MKKNLLSMAALALIMAGCSNDNDDVKIDKDGMTDAVPIQISQQVAGVETKAAIAPGGSMDANIIMVDAGTGTEDATNAPDFANFTPKTTNTITADESEGGAMKLKEEANRATVATAEFKASTEATTIKLNPTLYYPVTDSRKTWILGVAPLGIVEKTKVTFSDADGLQDVMYAEKVETSNTTASNAAGQGGDNTPTPVALEFKHKTTQLLFVAKLSGEGDLSNTEWEGKTVSVTSITIQKAQVPTAIKIEDGALECKEVSLSVAGCKVALKKDPCEKSVPVMIKESTSLVVDILLSVDGEPITYKNLTVKGKNGSDLATSAGKSHLITFEITPPVAATDAVQIGATAQIEDWTTGDEGTVVIK